MADGEPVLREKSFELLLEAVKNKKPKRILEIGVNRGLSGIAMLLVSEDSQLSGIEIDEEACEAHPYQVHTLRHYTGALTDIRPAKTEFYF